MRERKLVAGVGVGMVMAGAGVIAAGCFDSSGDCAATAMCEPLSAGAPEGCTPSEEGWAAEDRCGVFVKTSGDDGADGTAAAPLKTLARAIALAQTQRHGRVYACAERFTEAIEVPGGLAVHGGLDCANGWAWVGATSKTEVAGPADVVAVRIAGGEGVARLEDVAVQAADALKPGDSSIAVLVDQVSAELVRCDLRAGSGADGAPGAPGAEPDEMGVIPAAAAGMPGNAGLNACTDADGMGGPEASLLGGAQVFYDCGGGLTSLGGGGGNGEIASGGDGSAGQTGTLGAAGMGEPTSDPWSCPTTGVGKGGSDGIPGLAGSGATGTGTLTKSGYVGVGGGPGTPGRPGQGGGGGGGAKGGNCSGNQVGAGASGGSGGAGGCGGRPGQGGGAGGASIALVSIDASVALAGCTLTAGSGGRGGAGGDSQAGGAGGGGGLGGEPVGSGSAACDGGKGGRGGNGGPGGGGLGGLSAAIAHVGSTVTKDAATTLDFGTAGAGGPGGNHDDAMNSGAEGAAAQELEMQRSAAP